MEEKSFRTWKEFTRDEYRRFRTFQLSIEEFAKDLYYDETKEVQDETEELNFDY